MEQFDILDKNGNPIGQTADKGSSLLPGQYYLGTHVYVFNSKKEFLLQQRALDKKFLPGGWDIHCEHTLAGETSMQCAIRGLQEELGITAYESDFRFIKRFKWEEDRHFVDVYFLQAEFDIAKLNLQTSEVIGAKAIPLTETLALVEIMHYRPVEYRQSIQQELSEL